MKVSHYIANYLKVQGVNHIYEMIGGMITHILDSLHTETDIHVISLHHEQAAGFAAEASARLSGIPGVALATSGPGATNLITSIGSCYFDSVPTVFITGQVNTNEQKQDLDVRQLGFQETDIVSIVKPITKAAWLVTCADEIPEIFNKAFQIALSDRPGPVLIDIPMNIQRAELPNTPAFIAKSKRVGNESKSYLATLKEGLKVAQKPIILAGGGINSAGVANEFRKIVNQLGIPVVNSLQATDVLPYSNPFRVGLIGTYGNRWANMALAQSDLILVLGSRLDVRQTGALTEEFATNKKIFHIDCDQSELNNRIKNCLTLQMDLQLFFNDLSSTLIKPFESKSWMSLINDLKNKYPDTEEIPPSDSINPNQFLNKLSQVSQNANSITVDVGNNQMWAAQSFQISKNQRFLSSGGMGSMGFGLPSAIGAAFTTNKPVISISGDGGFQCNIQELQTIAHHQLPIKIIVFNNNSLGMVRNFQKQYFEQKYQSTVWGYSAPNFVNVASAYQINSKRIDKIDEIEDGINFLWEDPNKPALLEVVIDIETPINPKIAFGKPISEMEPLK